MCKKFIATIALSGGLLLAAASVQAKDPMAKTAPDDLLNATLWTQSSVEYKANAMAAYSLAKVMLDKALADKSWTAASEQTGDFMGKPPAVVLDLDETVLDNSEYEAWIVENKTHYSSKTWGPYVDAAISKPIPGSLDFIKYAAAKGVEIFYVSNRKAPNEAGTRKNLEKLGYPVNGKTDTVLLRGENDWGSKKSSRRAYVAKNYRILLLLGDNLGDFTDQTGGSPADRMKVFQANQARWGTSWIMIANPMYGSWESAAFKGNWKLPSDERRKMKIDALSGWSGPAK